MKPYFTKYLPVEGEIKVGDLIPFDNCQPQRIHRMSEDKVWVETDNGFPSEYNEYNRKGIKKAQLFLCSRDIQVGDKFHREGSTQVYERTDVPSDTSKDYKVIGPISPEATWVKEGDEFNEIELLEATEWRRPHSLCDEDREYKLGYYKIKGPCGHYH